MYFFSCIICADPLTQFLNLIDHFLLRYEHADFIGHCFSSISLSAMFLCPDDQNPPGVRLHPVRLADPPAGHPEYVGPFRQKNLCIPFPRGNLFINKIAPQGFVASLLDRKSTRLNSSHVSISYAVFCWKKNNTAPHADRKTIR